MKQENKDLKKKYEYHTTKKSEDKIEKGNNKIQQLSSENKNLKEKINQFQSNPQNNISNSNGPNETVRLYKKIEEFTEKPNRYPFIFEKNEKMLSVVFYSASQNRKYSMICKNTDTIHKLEEELYKEYPELFENDNYFI